MDTQARFWSKVRRTSTCWWWSGSINKLWGYGYVRFDGKFRRAHRVAFELVRGPIPTGMVLDHLCRNRACVRPDHLDPVTQQENCRRGMTGKAPGTMGARNKSKTHCPSGHAYADGNLYVHGRRRHCRACRRINAANRAAVSA